MHRKLSLPLIVVLMAVCLSSASFAWKFASIADSRGSNNGVNTTVFQNIVNRINAEGVDLVLFQGDAVSGSSSDATCASQMDTWLPIINSLNCPWYYVPGNHEIGSATQQENVLRPRMVMPANGPSSDLEMVWWFDHENARFYGLNSDHYGQQHHVQNSWLLANIQNATQPHVFVMAHDPAYPAGPHVGSSLDAYPSERDEFWNILCASNVRMYFCGHEHLYQRTLHGSVYQVINGTCGAPLASATGAISEYHYVVVTVDGNNVSAVMKNDSGVIRDTWSYTVTVPTETDCGSAKLLPDGALVRLKDKTVTCVRGNAIYVEEGDRSSAFRISGVTGLAVGDRVTALGTLQANASGERELQGSAIRLSSGSALPKPLGMTNRSLLGGLPGYSPATDAAGCDTSSLLVRIFGKVTKVGTGPDAGYFYIDDGSGIADGTSWDGTPNVGVRVYWPGGVSAGDMKTMTGICSSFKNGANVRRLLYSTDKPVLSGWTAYNDLVYSSTQGHPVPQPNVTMITIGSGSPGPSSGVLKDFATGLDTGVTATLVQSGGVVWQPDSITGGSDCSPGTDAYNTFSPSTASLKGVVYYGSAGWYVDLTLTGLDPSKRYEFATSANRNDVSYTDRIGKFTISSADAFTNASTAGVTVTNGGASSAFNTGYNTAAGYVARWTDINPGADGSFKVRAEAGSSQYKAYAFSAFMLKQLP